MTGRELARLLHAGDRVFGTLITSPSPHWPPVVQSTGIDFVFIDTEHIPIERATLAWMCQTYRALGLPPVVRIPEPDPYQACMALDGGACGVLAPYVESASQVRALYGAVKLRPLKGQVLQQVLNGEAGLPPVLGEYVRDRNADNLLFINIESRPAVDGLEEILAVPGIDAVQVGPHDLSCSLGVPEQYEHPLFLQYIERIISVSRRKSIGVGIHYWKDLQQEIRWAALGANLVVHSGDITLFKDALTDDLKLFRAAFQDESAVPPSGEFVV